MNSGICFDEGYIITVEDGREYLLIEKNDNYYFAVQMIDEIPTNNYIILESSINSDGNWYIKIVEEL